MAASAMSEQSKQDGADQGRLDARRRSQRRRTGSSESAKGSSSSRHHQSGAHPVGGALLDWETFQISIPESRALHDVVPRCSRQSRSVLDPYAQLRALLTGRLV